MVGIGCDHGGLEIKNVLRDHLKELGYEVKDHGVHDKQSVDYPDIAKDVCSGVTSGEYEFAVLVCGTGIGISIAANKIDGIRCALVNNEYSAAKTKEHNNANVLAFGGRTTGPDLAVSIIDSYINAEFQGGRHQNRIDKIHELEK